MSASNPDPAGTTRFGRYQLLELVGAGGMGEVYRAQLAGVEGFHKYFALKRIYPHLSSDARHRELFVREAKMVAELRHPNIVQVFDLGEADGGLFIAMEYVEGIDIGGLARHAEATKQRLSAEAVAVIAFDMLEALDYAHNKRRRSGDALGIVHQDVSPQNILIDIESGVAKLCDFGVANLTSEQGDAVAGVRGKVAYMAPEQARLAPVDGRADIFGLGAVMFRLLAGRPLIDVDDESGRLHACRQGTWDDPLIALADADPTLARIIARSVEAKPEDRYSDAATMRTDIEAYLVGIDPRRARLALREQVIQSVVQTRGEPHDPSSLSRTPPDTAASLGWTRLLTRVEAGSKMPARKRPIIAAVVALLACLAGAGVWAISRPVVVASPVAQPVAGPAPTLEIAPVVIETSPVQPEPRRAREPKPVAYGQLTLNAIPWARVTLDGKVLTKPTPIVDYRVTAGAHTVVLEGPERSVTLTIQVKAHGTTTKLVDLR